MRRPFRSTLALAVIFTARAITPADAQTWDWEQVETEHFLFLFESRDRPSVDELLTFCEDVYAKVTGFFESRPAKVPCVLRGRLDYANGFTMSFPSKIELCLMSPPDHTMGARTESWLKILLTHELTHFVHQSMDRGFFHELSLVMGADVAALSLLFLPGWMIEGPSTNLETLFTAGGRGRNPLFELYAKAPIAEGKLFTLEQAGYPSAFPPPGRIYVAGHIMIDYLLTTYGREAFTRIMEKYLDFPFFGPWTAIEKVTGDSAAKVFQGMLRRLSEKYRNSVPSVGKFVTPNRIADYTRPLATEKGLLLYRSTPDLFPAIVRFDGASGAERILLEVRLADSRSFSATADGQTVYLSTLFTDTSRPAEEETIADLCSLDIPSGVVRRITHGAHLWHPAISPDGRHLVAVQGAGPYTRLVSVDPRSGEVSALFSRFEANVYTPAFSPDGRRLAFTFNLRGFQDVFVADFDELRARSKSLRDSRAVVEDVNADAAVPVLGPDPYGEYFPSFLDNDRLLFSSDRGGSLSLYRADLATGKVDRILSDPVAAVAGVRDGGSLLYSTYSDRGWRLKSIPTSDLTVLPLDPPSEPRAYPGALEWTGRAVQSRPYTDWPLSYALLPNLTLTRTGRKTFDREIGIGAVVTAASLLGINSLSIDFAWSLCAAQPLAGLSFSTAIGPVVLDAQSRLAYGYAGLYAQSMTNRLMLSYPLLAARSFDTTSFVSLNAGLRHSAQLIALGPFTFAQAMKAPTESWGNYLETLSGVQLAWQIEGGRLDFNPPLAIAAYLQDSTALPVLSARASASAFSLFLALNIPSPFAHQVIKLGTRTSFLLGSLYGHSFAVPRGFPDARAPAAPCATLASLDYLVPIALLDRPLLFGWAVTAAGLGLHAERIGGWGLSPARLDIDGSIYVGGDITVKFVCGSGISLPIGVGLAARIAAANPNSFDPAKDLDAYFFMGFDSFGSFSLGRENGGSMGLPR